MLCIVNGGIMEDFAKNFNDDNPHQSNAFRNSIKDTISSKADLRKLQSQVFSKPQKIEKTNPLSVFFSDLTG